MSIVIDENIVAVWFCDLGPDEDYMMSISRREEGGMRFIYRVRHHHPDSKDPFDGKDEKSWNAFETTDPNEEKAIHAAREMVKGLIGLALGLGKVKLPHKIYELVRGDSSVEEFGKRLLESPWAHAQRKTLQ